MRAYLPVGWEQLESLVTAGSIDGPLRGCTVDQAWRAGSPEVDEEAWEYEAQSSAADALADIGGGAVLAVEVALPGGLDRDDGWCTFTQPVCLADVRAVFTADLEWFGVLEVPALLHECR